MNAYRDLMDISKDYVDAAHSINDETDDVTTSDEKYSQSLRIFVLLLSRTKEWEHGYRCYLTKQLYDTHFAVYDELIKIASCLKARNPSLPARLQACQTRIRPMYGDDAE